jgi:hypothetical protein
MPKSKPVRQTSTPQKKEEKKEERPRFRSRRGHKPRSGYGKAYDMFLPKALRSVAGRARLEAEATLEMNKRPREGRTVDAKSEMVH